MAEAAKTSSEIAIPHVELRQPVVAALLAWLWPGAGHIYQARYGKGLLYMVCIVSTWFFGLSLGGGHSVYASNKMMSRRLVFGCQLGVGLPAFPAIVQAMRISRGQQPLWNRFMAPPRDEIDEYVPYSKAPSTPEDRETESNDQQDRDSYLRTDELSAWNYQYGAAFDLGVLYTMVAGLLNILAIYDAYGGPMVPLEEEKKTKPAEDAKSPNTAA